MSSFCGERHGPSGSKERRPRCCVALFLVNFSPSFATCRWLPSFPAGAGVPKIGPRKKFGGIAPLVFGQYGELSNSFESLIDTLAVKGCDQAADHYLLDVGPGAASVQKRLLRQRVNCCVARAQAGVLLSRLKFALPGWAQVEGRRAAEQRARFAQRAEQARAYYSGEGRHSEEWGWSFGRPAH